MYFKKIIGQQQVKQKLIQSARENRIPHAQLFLGPPGNGKLALAMAYAQYINCEHPGETDSCGTCPSCIKISKLIHPDVHFSYPIVPKKSGDKPKSTEYLPEWRSLIAQSPYINVNQWLMHIQAENKQGNIPVSECHDIIRKLNLKAFEAKYKVMIIWLPEYLRLTGNVLLKIIEEPPDNTIFILVAEQQEMILNTILSRTQLLKINQIEDADLKEALVSLHEQSEEAAQQITNIANGNYQEALRLLSEEANDNQPLFREWMVLMWQNKGPGLVDWVDDFNKLGRENQKNFLRYGLHFMREMMLVPVGGTSRLNDAELQMATKLGALLTFEQMEEIIQRLEKAHYHIERYANPKILFLNMSIQITRIIQKQQVTLSQ